MNRNIMEKVIADEFVSDGAVTKKSKSNTGISSRIALKSKENVKEKSLKKSMNKKLKKYKLRKDGKDDPDVLDISHCLSSTLTIISPISRKNDVENFKMRNRSNSSPSKTKVGSSSKKTQNETSSNLSNGLSSEKSPMNVSENIFSPKLKNRKKKEQAAYEEPLTDIKKLPENKHLNAFQVMMTARHKSIGGNSPGKDNKDSPEVTEKEMEKKELRVKRTLALQKMADLKGGKEKSEVEANKDLYIKQQLDERAVRLREMLGKSNKKNGQTETINDSQGEEKCKKTDPKRLKGSFKNRANSSALSTVNKEKPQTILDLVKKMPSPPEIKKHNVDDDFLKNLSPSIKKKESMLSYFEKTDKKVLLNEDEFDTIDHETESTLIKVKFTPKRKKSKSKKKNELLKIEEEGVKQANCEAQNCKIPCEIVIKKDIEKTTEESIKCEDKVESAQLHIENITSPRSSLRPRRNVKRPIKYLSDSEDNVTISSCENEILHIFTPKKLKKAKSDRHSKENSTKSVTPIKILNLNSSKETICIRSPKTRNTETKKNLANGKKTKKEENVKLASIFMPKPVLEKSVIEARQKFLQSGVPEQLKKIIEKQKPFECILEDYFPVVTHVQQISCHGDSELHNTTNIQLENLDDQEIGFDDSWKRNKCLKQFLDSCTYSVKSHLQSSMMKTEKKKTHKYFLKEIKDAYPEFPVYRTYKYLKEKHSRENENDKTPNHKKDDNVKDSSFEILSEIVDMNSDSPEHFMWTDKYKANSSTEIIGNFKSVNVLKKWLLNWKEYNEEQGHFIKNSQNRIRRDSDSWLDDSDSHDSSRPLNNVTLVTGPQGCGKTSAVYAVATELSIKVLEVNASAKRTGKKLLSDLQEATQSHKVNRSKGLSLENSQNSQDYDVWEKKRKQKFERTYSKTDKKTVLSQKCEDTVMNDSQKPESTHVMSLILIEDADLVFEQDDGFISALTQIVQYSKRPIIIVTGNMHCAHLQRFIQGNNVLEFKPLSPKMLGTWLDLLILVEKDNAHPKLGSWLLEMCQGDIRKAIHTLQFWIGSNSHRAGNSANLETYMSTPEDDLFIDENSSSSCFEGETVSLRQGLHSNLVLFDVVKTFTSYCYEENIQSNKLFKMQYPTILSNVWWNVPAIWNLDQSNRVETSEIAKKTEKCAESVSDSLNDMSKFLEILSLADCIQATAGICQISPDLSLKPWLMSPASSVSDSEDLSMYNRHERFQSEWTYFAINTSLKHINRKFGGLDEFHNIDFSAPATKKISERDTINKSHNTLYEAIPYGNQLERRGLAIDYLPALRSVARIEKERADKNHKRNNRFCHYMRSLRIPCDVRMLESLCSSLDTEQDICGSADTEQS